MGHLEFAQISSVQTLSEQPYIDLKSGFNN